MAAGLFHKDTEGCLVGMKTNPVFSDGPAVLLLYWSLPVRGCVFVKYFSNYILTLSGMHEKAAQSIDWAAFLLTALMQMDGTLNPN
jgi:hypothetical protein